MAIYSCGMWQKHHLDWFKARLAEMRSAEPHCLVADLPSSAEAFLAWGLHRAAGQSLVWVADGPRTLNIGLRDLQSLAPGAEVRPAFFPPADDPSKTARAGAAPRAFDAERLAVLTELRAGHPTLVATCVQALLQPLIAPDALAAATVTLTRGQALGPEALATRLQAARFRFVPEVQFPNDAAVRGGLLDVWPISSQWPARIEFEDDALASIRTFDPESQRSVAQLDSLTFIAIVDTGIAASTASLLDYVPNSSLFIWSDLAGIGFHAGLVAEANPELALTFTDLRRMIDDKPGIFQVFVGTGPEHLVAPFPLDFKPNQSVASPVSSGSPIAPDVMESARRRFVDDLAIRAGAGCQVQLHFDTEGGQKRFGEMFEDLQRMPGVHSSIAPLSGGFSSDTLRLAVVSEADLYGRRIPRQRHAVGRAGPRLTQGARIGDWTDMEPGDLVVHIGHGIGRYLGLREIKVNEILQEALAIEYADNARLYVPVSQAHLLTRYMGVGKRFTGLHKLGGNRWAREKASAERAIHDFASQLLETQAARETLAGHAFPADTPWQHEFEAAFPFTETPDQERAIMEVRADMERPRPMDRLICGDAGYGKTEVAMRATFKAVMNAKQAAVLVPTTVLAQQHFQTFTERMAAFPVAIAMLSRFCSAGRQAEVLAGLRDGSIDIVIGTHGLLQPSVQFRDLGLVVIDEEQRFGVLHKERFKHIRRLVDVLTMTATPIPRTLYMSLTGARDLSTIQTPPQDRIAVETKVVEDTDEVIRAAILFELNRAGQIFYIYNRVMTIDRIVERLERIAPQARIGVAHGQMPAGELADVMRRFTSGELDLLVSTTIVESGLDIPNANTIIIDRADRFGLAELYQLRGRVGRSAQKGYAYMLLPGRATIDPIARKRIQAITHYADHGAGFRLAMRDLEIRGAGNLLGTEQSGHITAIGFGLYCQLLKRTVALRRGEDAAPVVDVDLRLDFMDYSPVAFAAPNSAVIPAPYIEDERQRVGMYRKIAEASRPAEIEALRKEFRDRFGPLPKALARLLQVAQLRISAAGKNIAAIETREEKVICTRNNVFVMPHGKFPCLRKRDPDGKLKELVAVVETL